MITAKVSAALEAVRDDSGRSPPIHQPASVNRFAASSKDGPATTGVIGPARNWAEKDSLDNELEMLLGAENKQGRSFYKTLAERFEDEISLERSSAGGSPSVTPRKESKKVGLVTRQPSFAERLTKELGLEEVGDESRLAGLSDIRGTTIDEDVVPLTYLGDSRHPNERQQAQDTRGRSPTQRPGLDAPTFGMDLS